MTRAGGGARDSAGGARQPRTTALIERGLEADLLLLSGGVSAGKYDIVETVLASWARSSFSTAS